jgi:SSS family solute:Na+ symporter
VSKIHLIDFSVIALYLLAMIGVGLYFSRKNKTASQFTKASGKIPGWALGLSLYATFLSSNTFLGVPGKAFGSNWNSYVFSLSMPFAAFIAAKYFVKFYRDTNSVSAYTNLENRFGPWARTYAVLCFLLTQLARMGSVFLGIAITIQALTNLSMPVIMLTMGICVIIYTVLGGIEAVIWTEVVQAVIKTAGALLIVYLIVRDLPGGISDVFRVGAENQKFGLGTLRLSFSESSFWVVLLYGFFINLNNFGMDQNYVQRYHAAPSEKQARKSVWFCVYMYVPVSLLFFFIGTALFAYYKIHPDMLTHVREIAASEKYVSGETQENVHQIAKNLTAAEYGDKIMPDFMVRKIPPGVLGLIVSAILSAAMSSISSSMNASATVFTEDIFKRYLKKDVSDRFTIKVLYIATAILGILGMGTGIAMIGAKSVLDIWWQLSGIFAGGMLGLFLLGMISKTSGNREAVMATIIGILVIIWMTFPKLVPEQLNFLRSPFHENMVIVIGTLSIFLSGFLISGLKSLVIKRSEF